MKANVYLKSRDPIEYQPEIFFFNYIHFRHKSGIEYLLEWEKVEKHYFIDSEGYVYLSLSLDAIYDCFEDMTLSDITSSFLRDSEIVNFCYECAKDFEEMIIITFDILTISIDCCDAKYIIGKI